MLQTSNCNVVTAVSINGSLCLSFTWREQSTSSLTQAKLLLVFVFFAFAVLPLWYFCYNHHGIIVISWNLLPETPFWAAPVRQLEHNGLTSGPSVVVMSLSFSRWQEYPAFPKHKNICLLKDVSYLFPSESKMAAKNSDVNIVFKNCSAG